MSISKPGDYPFKSLGLSLQRHRQRFNQSISEVSGAVEIDEQKLVLIENGKKRPTEDILLLLIAHFKLSDDDATKLWDQAGYASETNPVIDEDIIKYPPILLMIPIDTKVIYSDKTEVVANPNGLVINFMQQPNGAYQSQTVSRIGMSTEQAKTFANILNQTIQQLNSNQKNKTSVKPKKQDQTSE